MAAGVSGRGTAVGAGGAALVSATGLLSAAGLLSGKAGAAGFTGELRATGSAGVTCDLEISSLGSIRVDVANSLFATYHYFWLDVIGTWLGRFDFGLSRN